jgi:putative acetyltransferase
MTGAAGVTLRRAAAQDAESLATLMSDEAVYAGVLQMPYPSVERWRKRLDPQADDDDSLHLLAVADGGVIASAGIQKLGWTPRRRHAGWLGMTVSADWQGRGIGSLLMKALLDWADSWAGLLRIELTVYTDNTRAIALYERFGFVHEGTHRAYALRAGCYVDAHAMARLHPHPPQLPGQHGLPRP